MNIIGKLKTLSEVPTPPFGYITIFTDSSDNRPKYIDSNRDLYDYTGPQGVSGTIQVGTVTTTASNVPADVDNVGTVENAILNFSIPRGRSILSVLRTAGNGAENTFDTFTITYDDSTTDTFQVYNGSDGRSIESISVPANAGQPGATDVYTINYNKAPLTSTFVVYNGQDGSAVTVRDEGTVLTSNANSINFVGAGVTATNTGGSVTVTIPQPNSFGVVTGNTGTASSDQANDSLAITGSNGITTNATDTPDGLVITPNYGSPVALGVAANDGTSASFARADHVHPRPSPAEIGVVSFSNIAVSGQNTVVADSSTDTLTLVAGSGITLTTDAANDSVTITGTVQAPQNTFSNVLVGTTPTPTTLVADLPTDTVSVNAGTGITLTADAVTDSFTITNSGVTSVSVNGGAAQTGTVSITTPALPLAAKTTNLFTSTANSTAVQSVVTLTIPANYLTAGKTFNVRLDGTQSQSAAATNVVVAIFVNGTQVVSAAVAGGTAAQTNRSIRAEGAVLYNGTVFYGNIVTGISGVLPVGNANVTGVAAVAANTNTIEIRVQTSTANAANIIRATSAFIAEV